MPLQPLPKPSNVAPFGSERLGSVSTMMGFRALHGVRNTLAAGGVIAYPTEAVYGYGCDPFNPEAVIRLLALKRRPVEKGLIMVAAHIEQLAPLLEPVLPTLTPAQRDQLVQSWPGPNTWIVPDVNGWVPAWVRGRHSSVAVRVSAHPTVKALCECWGGPLVSSSANIAGQEPARAEWPLRRRLRGADLQPDWIVGGATDSLSRPTRIRDLLTGETLRA